MTNSKGVNELADTLRWIIRRIEEESEKQVLQGRRANWKQAALESVEEAYGALGRFEYDQEGNKTPEQGEDSK